MLVRLALVYRGTGCVNCARPDLWGAWSGNRWAYPEHSLVCFGVGDGLTQFRAPKNTPAVTSNGQRSSRRWGKAHTFDRYKVTLLQSCTGENHLL